MNIFRKTENRYPFVNTPRVHVIWAGAHISSLARLGRPHSGQYGAAYSHTGGGGREKEAQSAVRLLLRRPRSTRLSLRWSDCPEYIEKRTYVVCINACLLARIHTVTQI